MSDLDNLKNTIDRVSDIIDDAIRSNDYTDLSRQIGGLMRSATDAVQSAAASLASGAVESALSGESARSYAGTRRKVNPAASKQLREAAEQRARERSLREAREAQYFEKPGDTTGQKIMTVIGGAGAVIFGALTLITGVWSSVGGVLGRLTSPLAVLSGVVTAASIVMVHFGRKAVKKNELYRKVRAKLAPHLYASVEDLAKDAGISEKKMVSELKDFTKKGMIRQGHFDEKETTFIASDEIYEQYRSTAKRAEELRQMEAERAEREQAVDPEVRELLQKGQEYIRMIHEANDRIPGEEVSDKLYRMETITKRIFEEVRKRPELAGSLNLFMNYYLPTTTKLVKAYEEMDGQTIQGENIRTARREIENSLDTINDAFEKLLDSFFKEQAMDVSSDINVMKMMMKQEGLTEDDLTAMKRKQAAKAARAAGSQGAGVSQAAVSATGAGEAPKAAAVQTAASAGTATASQAATAVQAQVQVEEE